MTMFTKSIRRGLQAILLSTSVLLGQSAGVFAEPVKLTFATGMPPVNPLASEVMQVWADAANEAAKGEYEIEVVNGFALANYSNMWERVETGVVDIGFGLQGLTGMGFDKTSVVTLPVVVTDPIKSSAALWSLYEDGTIADEYEGVKVLGLASLPVQGISATKPINSLEDIAGMKVRAADRVSADTVTALGGAPIALPTTEVYQALSRGVVEGAVVTWLMVGAFKVGEVAHYHQRGMPLGTLPAYIVMNQAAFDRLSPEGQAALASVSGRHLSDHLAAGHKAVDDRIEAAMNKDEGQHVETLSDDEKALWESKLLPVIDTWKQRTPNGDAVLDAYEAALKAQ